MCPPLTNRLGLWPRRRHPVPACQPWIRRPEGRGLSPRQAGGRGRTDAALRRHHQDLRSAVEDHRLHPLGEPEFDEAGKSYAPLQLDALPLRSVHCQPPSFSTAWRLWLGGFRMSRWHKDCRAMGRHLLPIYWIPGKMTSLKSRICLPYCALRIAIVAASLKNKRAECPGADPPMCARRSQPRCRSVTEQSVRLCRVCHFGCLRQALSVSLPSLQRSCLASWRAASSRRRRDAAAQPPPARRRPPLPAAAPAAPAPPAGSAARRRPETPPMRLPANCRSRPPCPSSISARNMRSRCRSLIPRRSSTDKGIQGARLIIKEANQAGTFVGFAFELVEAIVPANADVVAKAKEILAKGNAFIIADLEPKDLSPSPTCPRPRTRSSSTSAPTRKRSARSSAAPMSSTSFPTGRCAPTRLGNTSSGRNGRAGS